MAGLGHLDGKRKADVAQADDAEDRRAILKSLLESHVLKPFSRADSTGERIAYGA